MIGARSNVTTVTSYLAELTTKLSKLSAIQPQKQQLQQQLITAGKNSFLSQHINHIYKKKDNENYLQYFLRILNNPLTQLVRLNSTTDPFSLCQDLHILTNVSLGKKALQKVLQEMIKYGNVYRQNERNQLIKRPLSKVISRYHFLKTSIQEEQIKYIVNWISEKGLQKDAFIENMNCREGNIDKVQNNNTQRLKIRITNKVIESRNSIKRKNNKYTQTKKRQNPILAPQMSENTQQQYQWEQNHLNPGRKKQKQSVSKKRGNLIQENQNKQNNVEKSIEKIFSTPNKPKIDLQQPNAPKKQYKSQYSKQTTKPTIIDNNQQPTQRRKYSSHIDSKKDITIKQDNINNNNNSKEQQQQQRRININVDTIKLNRTLLKVNKQIKIQTPKISQFILYPKTIEESNQQKKEEELNHQEQEVKLTVNGQNNYQNYKKQEEVKLQQILMEFQQKTKHSKVKILKLLDEVSGDLIDLRVYLQTENKALLWKRLEDAVLRKYVREKLKGVDINNKKSSNHPKLKIQLMYNELLATKGPERIAKRIRYLNLVDKHTDSKSPPMIT